ncbi:MAG: SdiA-regulated domain-containing protein [Pseudomonadota bacterium]
MKPFEIALALALLAPLSTAHASEPTRATQLTPPVGNRIPITENTCSLNDLGLFSPSGLSFVPDEQLLALADRFAIYLITQDCEIDSSFTTEAAGFFVPQGVAYDELNDGFALVESDFDQLHFVNRDGSVVGWCDLAAIGATSATGIAYRAVDDTFVITDEELDTAFVVDRSEIAGGACEVVDLFSLSPLYAGHSSGITYDPTRDVFLIADDLNDFIYLADGNDFSPADQLNTSLGFGANTIEGLAFSPAEDRLYVVDRQSGMLFRLDIRGKVEPLCDTAALGSTRPEGLTFIAETNEIVWIDGDHFFLADAESCALNSTRDLFGFVYSFSVAYLAGSKQLAFFGGDQLRYFDLQTDELTTGCDYGSLGFSTPKGLASIPGLESLLITDENGRAGAVLDLECNLLRTFALSIGGVESGVDAAEAVAFDSATGHALVLDSGNEGAGGSQAFVFDSKGQIVLDFDLAGLSILPNGVTGLGDGVTFAVADESADMIYRMTLPALAVPSGVGGSFRASGLAAEVVLFERGEGRITGSILLQNRELPVYGQRSGNRLSLGFDTPAGMPVATRGVISADLNVINTNGPLGVLRRNVPSNE